MRATYDLPGMAPIAGMSWGARSNDVLCVAGQAPVDSAGKLVSADVHEQARQCFDNLELILKQAGSSLADLIKLTCYTTDEPAYQAYATVKAERFAGLPHPPAGTAVIVAGLLIPGMRIEVDGIAVVGAKGSG